ncbi:hypothetical protein Q7P35_010475 [Cladosporium inversicolor]
MSANELRDAITEDPEQDHEIKIKEGAELKKEPLRPISAEKAEYVRKYVDEGLRKGHIRESESPAGYLLHIVLKGDEYRAYINNVLRKYLDVFVVVYLDDILVYSKTYDDHVRDIQKVLQALADAKMKIKPEKTEFHKTEVKFLRYIFIKDYSKIAAPLTELTKKDKEFVWSAEAEEAFQELKTRFSTEPILVIFDPKKPSIVETDTSDKAIRACLSQADDKGKLRLVAYLSRKFTLAESNYKVHDKELLAIIEAFPH